MVNTSRYCTYLSEVDDGTSTLNLAFVVSLCAVDSEWSNGMHSQMRHSPRLSTVLFNPQTNALRSLLRSACHRGYISAIHPYRGLLWGSSARADVDINVPNTEIVPGSVLWYGGWGPWCRFGYLYLCPPIAYPVEPPHGSAKANSTVWSIRNSIHVSWGA